MSKIEKAILKTLAFFEIFSRPLTLEELWHFLSKTRASKLQVLIGLRKLAKKRLILQKNLPAGKAGNYFSLSQSPKIFKDFESCQKVCQKNWQKVALVIKILKFAPFVKNISVINSLSFGTSSEKSDIDILLITKKNRLWTARAFVVGLLELIGQNKNQWYQAGKFCLGFAFDETRLDLKNILGAKKYVWAPYWLANLTPVFDDKIYFQFIKENSWLNINLPNWTAQEVKKIKLKNSWLEKILKGRLGNLLEEWLAKIQIRRVYKDPQNLLASGEAVICHNQMLKMHPDERRPEYQRKWQEKLRQLENLTKKRLLR